MIYKLLRTILTTRYYIYILRRDILANLKKSNSFRRGEDF